MWKSILKLNFGYAGLTFRKLNMFFFLEKPEKEIDEFIYTFRFYIECREINFLFLIGPRVRKNT